ncbi:hypothetical protein VB796_08760 [Arcicella sp. LKC2W]|uniref:hypothetical protein n=1 Tax=Arcicella sp. LKC2W TaxID=2984198 RepID=UPI002B1EB32E|nr:hypothetical protein [Arcicella sp. LKC2W]MEA5459125.1 hypothetical protein [Arcicella sp. LKC2W]
MNELNFCMGIPKLSGIQKVRIALAENIVWQYQVRKSELATAFVFKGGIEKWIATYTSVDMTGDLSIEERKLDVESVDQYTLKLYFRHDQASSIQLLDWIEANFRNRKLAIEAKLETGEIRYLNPFTLSRKYTVKEDVGQPTTTELTFSPVAQLDTASRILEDEIISVKVDCGNKKALVKTTKPSDSYEFGYSLTDNIQTVSTWSKGKVIIPTGNGSIYFFVRDENEPFGDFLSKKFQLNCNYGGCRITIKSIVALSVKPIVEEYEDILTDGEIGQEDNYEDIELTTTCRIEIKTAKRIN